MGFEEETSNFLSSIKRREGIVFFGAILPSAVANYCINWHGLSSIKLLMPILPALSFNVKFFSINAAVSTSINKHN
jgi:hypothetical protein